MVAEPGRKRKAGSRKREKGNAGTNVVKDLDLL
jgi:hypothetical protein